jgi:hypothetical protein
MTGKVSGQGDTVVMNGAMGGNGPGYTASAVWSVTKQE